MTAPRTTTTRGNSKLTITVSNYTPLVKRSMVGKCDVHIRELRMTARGVLILSTNGRQWASLPSPTMLDKDGHALRDENGKVNYAATARRSATHLAPRSSTRCSKSKDFGVHDMGDARGGSRTPIDIVERHMGVESAGEMGR